MFEMYIDIDWGLKTKQIKLEQINWITLFLMRNEEWVYGVKWICRYLMRINEEGD